MTDDNASAAAPAGLSLPSLLLLAVLAVVPPVFATAFTAFETVKTLALVALTSVGLIAWGAAVLRRKSFSMVGARLITVALLFGLYCLFAILWAMSPTTGAPEALRWWALVALTLFATAAPGRPVNFNQVATATAIGALLAALTVFADALGVGLLTEVWDPPGFTGAFDSREAAMPYFAGAIPILATSTLRGAGPLRWLAAAGLLAASAALGLTTEWGMLAIAGGLAAAWGAVFVLLQGLERGPLLYPTLIATLVAFGVAAGVHGASGTPDGPTDATDLPAVSDDTPADQPGKKLRDIRFSIPRVEEVDSWPARSYVVGIAFDMFREQPIVGHGPGDWWTAQTKYPRANEPFVAGLFDHYPAFRSPHNGYARVMAEYGGVALLLLLLLLSGAIGVTVTALSNRAEPESWVTEHYALTASTGVIFLLGLFGLALETAAPAALGFVALGLLIRESAMLNDFRGMSQVWTVNAAGKLRWDSAIFLGVLPVCLGIAGAGFIGVWGVHKYHVGWGDLAMLRGMHEKADEVYGTADGLLPGDGEVLFNRALAKRRHGQVDEATELVNRAAELRPYDVRVTRLVSGLHLKEQKYAEAAQAARRSVELFPNYIEGRRALAAALDLQGRIGDAAKVVIDTLELDPPDDIKGLLHKDLGDYYSGPLKNNAKAIEHYEQALPLLEHKFLIKNIEPKLRELKKEVERERLTREGKPIPPELMPEAPPKGHQHGGGIPGLPEPHAPH